MKTSILSHYIHEKTPLYGGHKSIKITPYKSILKNDSSNVLRLSFNTHTSTHIDLPYHFLNKGKHLSDYPSHSWLFRKIFVKYIEVPPLGMITERDFEDVTPNKEIDCFLIKTGFEKFRNSNVYIEKSPIVASSLALFLKERFPSLKIVGFDFISLSALRNRTEGRKAHKLFLKNDITIVEDMKLSELEEKPDLLLVSPLLIDKADGAPTTIWAFYNEFNIHHYDYIFFDLDGVILDSVDIKTRAFKKLYSKYGLHITRKVVAHHKANGGMSRFEKFKFYHQEYLEINLNNTEIKALAQKFSRIVFKEVTQAPFIKGALHFLQECKKLRKTVFLVSATPQEELERIIRLKKINQYFKSIKGSPQDKTANIQDLIKKYKVNNHRSVFFGDSINDLKAASSNNIKFIGINYTNRGTHYKNFEKLK